MILKRKEGSPKTLIVSSGITQWEFSPNHFVFSVPDCDCFYLLSTGNFSLVPKRAMDYIMPEDVFVVERRGPAITGS
jgi:hypothetical protein